MSTRKITGKTLSGDTRQYEFHLVDAWTGVQTAHEYTGIVLSALPQLRTVFAHMFADDKPDDGGAVVQLAQLLPAVITWPRLQELVRSFLRNATIDDEDCGPDGMCEMFGRDPLELYTALFWALSVNYPKYFAPLLAAPTTGGQSDTTPENIITPTAE